MLYLLLFALVCAAVIRLWIWQRRQTSIETIELSESLKRISMAPSVPTHPPRRSRQVRHRRPEPLDPARRRAAQARIAARRKQRRLAS